MREAKGNLIKKNKYEKSINTTMLDKERSKKSFRKRRKEKTYI